MRLVVLLHTGLVVLLHTWLVVLLRSGLRALRTVRTADVLVLVGHQSSTTRWRV